MNSIFVSEFIVLGTPISLRASKGSRSAWKEKVASAARSTLDATHTIQTGSLRIIIVYFYVGGAADLDNILKPILDAMVNLVYLDDEQIVDIQASKRNLAGTVALAGVSPKLVAALTASVSPSTDFVYVRIEPADERTIP